MAKRKVEKETVVDKVNWKLFAALTAAALAMLMALLGSCDRIFDKLGVPHDSVVEEMAEAYIEHETGVTIDLTPSSPEGE